MPDFKTPLATYATPSTLIMAEAPKRPKMKKRKRGQVSDGLYRFVQEGAGKATSPIAGWPHALCE